MKISEIDFVTHWTPGSMFLPPLKVVTIQPFGGRGVGEALLELELPKEKKTFRFIVEIKSSSTPLTVRTAISMVLDCVSQTALRNNDIRYPMIAVPYLGPANLAELEEREVSGIDLCGNGIVIIPERLLIIRSGQENQYRESRSLVNPYSGKSALVGRMLLEKPEWESLNVLVESINAGGGEISVPQVSKTLDALCEELIVFKKQRAIKLLEKIRLLDNLSKNYKKTKPDSRLALRLEPKTEWPQRLKKAGVRWTVSGESSAKRYSSLVESGPLRIYVSDMKKALDCLGGREEPVRNFADLDLCQTGDPCVFFDSKPDDSGMVWSSVLQTYLELMDGDARQRDAALLLREQLSRVCK